MANFFDEEENKVEDQDPEVIKIGDEEYSQDQLERLVGLGKTAVELEEKWNTKIDRIYPEYTKSRQELTDRQKEIEELKASQLTEKANQGAQLTPEEIGLQAQQELRKLGYVPESEVRQIASQISQETLAGYKLLEEVNGYIGQMSSEGNPKTTPADLLQHMSDNGFKDPKRAYKDMFETELDRIKEEKIRSLRGSSIYTEHSSSAGGKMPDAVKPTKDNLDDLVLGALRGS